MAATKILWEIILLINVALSTALGGLGSLGTLVDDVTDEVHSKVSDITDDLTYNEDANLDTGDLIHKYGYQNETHQVTTQDGYILTMHRITGPKSNPDATGKRVVFLMHGLFLSSTDFVILGPGKAFAYILADEGYDVWMGNARGNTYSRTHEQYTDSDADFWMFSWHEIGVMDLPAMIDYVIDKTGRDKIFYVGHSQGTTVFYVMASEKPEYNDKITAMFSFGPVAYLEHTTSPFFRLLSELLDNPLHDVLTQMGSYEFIPANEFLRDVTTVTCQIEVVAATACTNLIYLIGGYGTDQLNETTLGAIFGHFPASVSARQVIHYGQLVHSGEFRQFDYETDENNQKYDQPTPPSYNFANIKAPVILPYALNDALSDVTDVKKLETKLPNIHTIFTIANEKFAHLDYTWGIDAYELVYSKTIAIMEGFENDGGNHYL